MSFKVKENKKLKLFAYYYSIELSLLLIVLFYDIFISFIS